MEGELEIKTLKVMMVEDDEHFRQTLKKLLMSRFPSFAFEEAERRQGGDGKDRSVSARPDLHGHQIARRKRS